MSVELVFNESTQKWEERKQPFATIEIETEEDFNRLRELVEADRDGRCVVLPCKAGDTVWVINHHLSRIFENKVTKIVVGYGSDNKNHMETVYIGKYGSATFRKWKLQQIGKTVFFSKEAAEAALKGEQDG